MIYNRFLSRSFCLFFLSSGCAGDGIPVETVFDHGLIISIRDLAKDPSLYDNRVVIMSGCLLGPEGPDPILQSDYRFDEIGAVGEPFVSLSRISKSRRLGLKTSRAPMNQATLPHVMIRGIYQFTHSIPHSSNWSFKGQDVNSLGYIKNAVVANVYSDKCEFQRR